MLWSLWVCVSSLPGSMQHGHQWLGQGYSSSVYVCIALLVVMRICISWALSWYAYSPAHMYFPFSDKCQGHCLMSLWLPFCKSTSREPNLWAIARRYERKEERRRGGGLCSEHLSVGRSPPMGQAPRVASGQQQCWPLSTFTDPTCKC